MSEYIDKQAVLHEMKMDIRPPFAVVMDFPPADVRPVVYGKKISDGFDEMYTEFFKCTICGCSDLTARSNFCPNCGADVRGGKP